MPHPALAHKSFADRNSLYQQITGKIIAELEQGSIPWVQPWDNVKAPLGLPKNATTHRAYSGVNVLILWMGSRHRTGTGFTLSVTYQELGHLPVNVQPATV
jgi:antirestriction protein ArdC